MLSKNHIFRCRDLEIAERALNYCHFDSKPLDKYGVVRRGGRTRAVRNYRIIGATQNLIAKGLRRLRAIDDRAIQSSLDEAVSDLLYSIRNRQGEDRGAGFASPFNYC